MANRKLQVEIVGDSRSLERALGRSSAATGAFGGSLDKLGRVAKVAGVAMAAGLGAGLVASAKSAVDFERQMRNVNSIANLGQKDFKALGKSVTGMAAEVGQKPKVLASGLYDIVSSGFKASDAVKVLRVSAKAATAGLTDTATASKAVTAALNAYHLGADGARKVSDVLFQTVNKGVLTFEELSQQMGDLVPAAAPLGVSLSEVGAGMATLTLQGVPAAEAATRMKNAMISLAKPTPAMTKLLKEQGFASGEAAVKAKGFTGVLQLLDKATHGSVAETAKLTPEIRRLLGFVGLTGKNLKVYEANLRSMNAAQQGAGLTARVFAEQSKSVGVQWQKAAAALDVFKIQVGTALLPAIASGLAALSGFLAKLNQAQGFKAKINVVIDVGKGLFDSLKLALLGGVVNVGDDVDVRMGFQNGLQQNLQKAIQGLDWASIGKSMLEGFRRAFQTSVGTVDEMIAKLNDAIVRNRSKIAESGAVILASIFTTLADPAFWVHHWDLALAVGLVVFKGRIIAAAGKFVAPFVKLGSDMVLGFVGKIEQLFPLAGAALRVGLNKLPAIVKGALKPLTDAVGSVFTKLGSVATFVVKVLGVNLAVNAIVKMGAAIGAKLGQIASDAYDWATTIGVAIVRGVISGLSSLVSALFQHLVSPFVNMYNKVAHFLGAKSPSKLFEELGISVGQGFAIGVSSSLLKATQSSVDAIRKLTAQITAITEGEAAKARARAVTDAQAAVADARKKGEGVAAAEQQLADARTAIVLAGLEAQRTKEQAALDKRTVMIQKHFDKANAIIQTAQDMAATAFSKLGSKIMQAFDAETARKTPAEIALAQLQAAHEATRAAADLADAQQQLAAAQVAGDQEAILSAQQRLNDLLYQQQVNALQAQADQERTAKEQRRAILAESLQERIDLVTKKLTQEGASYKDGMAVILKILKSYGISFAEAGADLGESFVKSLQATIKAGARATQVVATAGGGGGGGQSHGPLVHVGGRAAGGPVTAGRPYLVGERGQPEIFTPGTSGNITPIGGGGSTVIQLVLDGRVISEVVRQDLIAIARRNGNALGNLA